MGVSQSKETLLLDAAFDGNDYVSEKTSVYFSSVRY